MDRELSSRFDRALFAALVAAAGAGLALLQARPAATFADPFLCLNGDPAGLAHCAWCFVGAALLAVGLAMTWRESRALGRA